MPKAGLVVLTVAAALMTGCGRRERSVCGNYLDRYSACIAKMGPAARDAAEKNLRRERDRIRELERDASTREQVVAACQASLEAIKGTCR